MFGVTPPKLGNLYSVSVSCVNTFSLFIAGSILVNSGSSCVERIGGPLAQTSNQAIGM